MTDLLERPVFANETEVSENENEEGVMEVVISKSPSINGQEEALDDEDLKQSKDVVSRLDKCWLDDTYDPIRATLMAIPDDQALQHVMAVKMQQQSDLEAVVRVLSEVVQSHHHQFVDGMQKVAELNQELELALVICKNGRRSLVKARKNTVDMSLTIIAKDRRRKTMLELLKTINQLRSLYSKCAEVEKLVAEGDYANALIGCKSSQDQARTLSQYVAMNDLDKRYNRIKIEIEDSLVMMQELLCREFDKDQYLSLLQAYRLLDDSHVMIAKQTAMFCSTITQMAHETAQGALREGVCPSSTVGTLSYKECCRRLYSKECYIPTLRSLCRGLCHIMHNHRNLTNIHQVADTANDCNMESEPAEAIDPVWRTNNVLDMIKEGRRAIWQQAQTVLTSYLYYGDTRPSQAQCYTIDDFLQILILLDRLLAYGELYSGAKGETLQCAVKEIAGQFFSAFHRAKMEDMRVMLEAEGWQPCPVVVGFSLYSLKECAFMRRDPNMSHSGSTGLEVWTAKGRAAAIECFHKGTNPFYLQPRGSVTAANAMNKFSLKACSSDKDDDQPDGDMGQPASMSPTVTNQNQDKNPPVLTTTTLNLLRYTGLYIQMMELLPDTTQDILAGLSQLVECYLTAVLSFFAFPLFASTSGPSEPSNNYVPSRLNLVDAVPVSDKLRGLLMRLRGNINGGWTRPMPSYAGSTTATMPPPQMSPEVVLTRPGDFLGLTYRVVGTESLQFVSEALESIRPYLDLLVPTNCTGDLHQFYTNTARVLPELCVYIYNTIATRLLNYETMLSEMTRVRWDPKDITTQHNPYVDVMVRELSGFSARLKASK
eukprot:Ihof_evm1s661 gene=Ihof_evmTU1s661